MHSVGEWGILKRMVVSDVVEIFYLLIWVLMMRMYSLRFIILHFCRICVSLFSSC